MVRQAIGVLVIGVAIIAAIPLGLRLAAFRAGGAPDEPTPESVAASAPSLADVPRAMQLLSPTEGWMLTDSALLWTSDGGTAWRDVTPRDLATRPLGAFFLDAKHGWLGAWNGQTATAGATPVPVATPIFHTVDGGRTWRKSLAPTIDLDAVHPGSIHFVDDRNGFAMVTLQSSAQFSRGQLVATTDGGATWTMLTSPSGNPIRFRDASTGWTTGGPLGERLWLTRDGGRTWADASLRKTDGERYELPTFFTARDGVLPITTVEPSGAAITFRLSRNGGLTWSEIRGPIRSAGSSTFHTAIVDASTWYVASDGPSWAIYLGQDEGRSWRQIKPDGLSAPPSELAFVNALTGWALADGVYRTDDGARTWRPIYVPATRPVPAPTPAPAPRGPTSLGAAPEVGTLRFFESGTFWRYEGATGRLSKEEATDPHVLCQDVVACRFPPKDAWVVGSVVGPSSAQITADRKLLLSDPYGGGSGIKLPDLEFVGLHWSPDGRTIALERPPLPGTTHPFPGATRSPFVSLPVELWLLDVDSGQERKLYDRPADDCPAAASACGINYYQKHPFRLATWSPDGRYIGLWEDAGWSGSIDADGRPLVLIDVRTGQRIPLGPTLTSKSWLAWLPPHTLAYVAGGDRMTWDNKTIRLWSPEVGFKDVTGPNEVGLAPAWDVPNQRLYFVRGPIGCERASCPPGSLRYTPQEFFPGRGVGDRHLVYWDLQRQVTTPLPRSSEYAEEGVRVSRDGSQLLVLRRRFVPSDGRSEIVGHIELWAFRPDLSDGRSLIRTTAQGFGYYGYYGLGGIAWSR